MIRERQPPETTDSIDPMSLEDLARRADDLLRKVVKYAAQGEAQAQVYAAQIALEKAEAVARVERTMRLEEARAVVLRALLVVRP